VRPALLALAVLAACSLREPRVTATSCAGAGQCSGSEVCFLGECRPPAANLSLVLIEVRPPTGSQFGLKEQQIDVGQSVLNDFTLAIPLTATGTVKQEADGAAPAPVAGATVTLTDHAPVIPDRVEQIPSVTDATGKYNARVPQGVWDVRIELPSPLPPLAAGVLDTTSPVVDFVVPNTSAFPVLRGGLIANGDPVAGASVTAIDARGAALSAPSVSQTDGGYALYLPPNSSQPTLQVGPPTDTDAGLPAALDPFPTYQSLAYVDPIVLTLPPVAPLNGRVLDSAGNPVASARVYVRSVNTLWTLARSVTADASGAYAFSLREGEYLVQAVPPADGNSPALSGQQPVTLPVAGPVDLTCPVKVRRFGQLLGPDGRPTGANFRIIATRLSDGLVTTRTAFTLPTDSNGIYHVIADAGRWRFEIVPPADSSLPRKIVQVDLDGADPGDSALPAVQISPPLKVVGTVKGSAPNVADSLVADAMLSFYSLDTNGRSVFLGSARTDPQGRYEAVLPDVKQPGLAP
jgi:carboxypeptidase family protein